MAISNINSPVVLFESDEKSLNYKFEPNGNNLNSITVASIEYDLDAFLQNKIIGQLPEIGSIYYKHPFKVNCYVNSKMSELYFMEEKILLFSNIVKLLGGKKFSGTLKIEEIQKIDTSISGRIKYKIAELDTKTKKSEEDKLTSKLELNVEFSKDNEFINFDRISSYNKALEIIESNSLNAETSLIGLIESRDPYIGNSNLKQTLKAELTSEFNSALENTANLSLMKGIFNLNVGFDKHISEMKKINVHLEIEF